MANSLKSARGASFVCVVDLQRFIVEKPAAQSRHFFRRFAAKKGCFAPQVFVFLARLSP
jgi:hypothetical protein